jgi:pimeloyl-ACP methyl ester carboxylesterase
VRSKRNLTVNTANPIIIVLFLTVASISVIGIVTNQHQIAKAQQQQLGSVNQTASLLKQQPNLLGLSFRIDNMTFFHHMASVNGIQMHYVIGGQGNPLVLLHGFPETWYEWRHVMPAFAKNYTVIVPDLRGLGDSSKPLTGYDGKTTAEDLNQLISQLGFKKILLVAHDLGAQTAFSYAATHPNNVSKLVIMDYIFPGFYPPQFGQNGPWWFTFHQVPNIPEFLVEGKEREYISSFVKMIAYNPSAITEGDLDVYAAKYSAPGVMRDGFEYYRAFPLDAVQDKALVNQSKLHVPVLGLYGSYYPGLGGNVTSNPGLDALKPLAQNVTVIKVPLSGHFIPEEQPQFVIKQLAKFFGNGSNSTKASR